MRWRRRDVFIHETDEFFSVVDQLQPRQFADATAVDRRRGVILMRKFNPRSQTKIANVLLAGQRKISLRGLARRHGQLFASAGALCCAATVSAIALLASSPAAAQFACTATATDRNCTNSGTALTFTDVAAGANQNDTVTNSGTANGFTSITTGGGNATATYSGSNTGGITAETLGASGNATAINSGNDTGDINAITTAGGCWRRVCHLRRREKHAVGGVWRRIGILAKPECEPVHCRGGDGDERQEREFRRHRRRARFVLKTERDHTGGDIGACRSVTHACTSPCASDLICW